MLQKRRSSGVFQLENGNWGYRFIATVNGQRKAQKRITDEFGNPFKTEAQAAKARAKNIILIKELIKSEQEAVFKPKPIPRVKVKDVFKEYCENGRAAKAYATKKKQDSLWKNYLLDFFDEKYFDEITPAEINDFLTQLYGEYNFAYGYVEAFLKQFYLIFGQAYNRNYLPIDAYNRFCVNKNSKITMPPRKSTDVSEIKSYSPEEYKKLETYFKGKNVETAFMIGRFCGVRVSECYGILWQDINFEDGYISINKQFKMNDGLLTLTPLKTKNAKRKVYMCSELQDFLIRKRKEYDEYEETYAEQRKQNAIQIKNIDGNYVSTLDLVNTLPNGRYQTEWAIKHHSRPIKNLYGIDFKFHFLRHTYGTNLALMNTPEHILLNQMGHSKNQTTHKYYLAVSEEGISQLKNNLEKL